MACPLFVRPLTRAEQKELARLVRTGSDARVVRRAQMIRMSAQGHPVPRIAEAWGVHAQTVRRTIKAFNAEGPAALADKPRPGRPPKAHVDSDSSGGPDTWVHGRESKVWSPESKVERSEFKVQSPEAAPCDHKRVRHRDGRCLRFPLSHFRFGPFRSALGALRATL